jgi:hypothetical protein
VLVNEIVIPNGTTSIGEYAFYNYSTLESIVIPNSVTTIGDYAFYYCTLLKSIVIPDDVTSIGIAAFEGCELLESVVIPDSVTYLDGRAFFNCISLTSVVIGNGVTDINNYTFSGCSSLTSVVIGNSVTGINGRAFENCISLTSIVIPKSVTYIALGAFYECTSLTDVYYTGTESQWNAIYIDSGNYYLENATIHYNYVKKLSPPTISISGSVISITGSNNVSVRYWIYVNGESLVSTTENSTSIDIAGLNLAEGTYSVYLVAVADGYENSEPSNTVEYVVSEEITDLAGYTVNVPAGWSAPEGYGGYILEGICDTEAFTDTPFTLFYVGYSYDYTDSALTDAYDVVTLYNPTSGGYIDIHPSDSFTLHLKGGQTDNELLIKWLIDNNATFKKTV